MITDLARSAKAASRALAAASLTTRNAVLTTAADEILANSESILVANATDVARAVAMGLSGAMVERLLLDEKRLRAIADGTRAVAALPDPLGITSDERTLPNGLHVARVRVPLGLIAIIYESRPNVTADSAALCLKSGNAVILRGGSEAVDGNAALALCFRAALEKHGLPADAVAPLPTLNREATKVLLSLSGIIDLAIPRGGEGLIRFVTENARVPVIQHYKGICHVYVDADADLEMAQKIVVNAKAQRPGVCNAMETLLIDRAGAPKLLPGLVSALRGANVEVRGDSTAQQLSKEVVPAKDTDFDTEHLALIANLAVVDGLDGAIAHIAAHGTFHTEVIVTRDQAKADRFIREVDASLVGWNASTRFNDGGELGLGAEIGISTSKLHAYGPMGLNELTTRKWVARGAGQVRG
ncbi:MAG: glutamate-5-semialdehyde dehydrogenase [Myxococcaceae bacterium]